MFTDIFSDDAFSLIALTAAINNVDHVPDRAGTLVFSGVGEGLAVTSAVIEQRAEALTLIQTSVRGGPAEKEAAPDKATLRSVIIPHIKIEDTVEASSIQGVREFGTADQLRSVQSVVNRQLGKMAARMDLTLENHRLGALRGLIKDANSATLLNLFTLFGLTNNNTDVGEGATDAAPKAFNMDLTMDLSDPDTVRVNIQKINRWVRSHAKMPIPNSATMWVFCGDNFFDKLIEREDVRATYLNTTEQQRRLGANYVSTAFEYAGVVWENYHGTDDGSSVAIDTDEAVGFMTGVPGLYAEWFAPGDFLETANTVGLPRYAKIAPDAEFNRYVKFHTQMNPLPICLRPNTLVRLLASV